MAFVFIYLKSNLPASDEICVPRVMPDLRSRGMQPLQQRNTTRLIRLLIVLRRKAFSSRSRMGGITSHRPFCQRHKKGQCVPRMGIELKFFKYFPLPVFFLFSFVGSSFLDWGYFLLTFFASYCWGNNGNASRPWVCFDNGIFGACSQLNEKLIPTEFFKGDTF